MPLLMKMFASPMALETHSSDMVQRCGRDGDDRERRRTLPSLRGQQPGYTCWIAVCRVANWYLVDSIVNGVGIPIPVIVLSVVELEGSIAKKPPLDLYPSLLDTAGEVEEAPLPPHILRGG